MAKAGTPISTSIGRRLNHTSASARPVGSASASVAAIAWPRAVSDAAFVQRKARQDGAHEDGVGRDEQIRRPEGAAQQPASGERAGAAGHEQHRQHQREDGAESAEQDGEVPQPQHLDPHGRTSRQRERGRHRGHLIARRAGGGRRRLRCDGGLRRGHGAHGQEREPGGGEVQRDGGQLRPLQSGKSHENEIGQQRAGGGAGGVGAIQPCNLTAAGLDVGRHERANEQRQGAAHRERDGGEQPGGERQAHGV